MPRALVSMLCASVAAGCHGRQSALDPAGRDAEQIATLFIGMGVAAIVIWAAVVALFTYALIRRRREHSHRVAAFVIIGGGVVFPTVVLTVLLVLGLPMLPRLLDLGPDEPTVAVSAEQWWWRVHYETPDGEVVELANEIRLPVGRRTPIALDSPDVIHSFWVPSLAGKIDAIPGRTNFIALEPTQAGIYKGVCAEYCGAAHAQMLFDVIAMEPEAYEAWLAHQAQPASPPRSELAVAGYEAFLAHGCGACHTIRGTPADGKIGPDLTHVGSRSSLSGVLSNEGDDFVRWITQPEHIKPNVRMPAFDMLPEGDLRAIAAFLDGLE